MSVSHKIAVVYGHSGMGDVGKYALQHALKAPGVTVKAIAMASRATAEPDFDAKADVQPEALQLELKDALKDVETAKIVIEEKNAQRQLEEQFQGVDAVIACVGSRQSAPIYKDPAFKSRWCELGAKKVEDAMTAKGVKRLVLLSSFGVGEDFVPFSSIKVIWGFILNVLSRAVKKDLVAMEKVTVASGLDYLLVRAAGLTPEEKITGRWRLLTGKGSKVNTGFFSIAKSDVGLFMLGEALQPTMHSTAVTIGGEK